MTTIYSHTAQSASATGARNDAETDIETPFDGLEVASEPIPKPRGRGSARGSPAKKKPSARSGARVASGPYVKRKAPTLPADFAPPLPPIRKTGVEFKEFCGYYNKLSDEEQSNVTIHVYRWFPVMVPPPEDLAFGEESTRKVRKFEAEHVSRDGVRAAFDETLVLRECGLGNYQFRLNNNVMRADGMKKTTILKSRLDTARDWTEHWPQLDMANVDWQDPANAVFIRECRKRQIEIPVPDESGKEEDMANSEVMASMVNGVIEQNRELLQEVKERSRQPAASGIAPIEQTAAMASIAMVSETAKAEREMLMAIVEKREESNRQQANPIDQLRTMGEVIKSFTPKADDSAITEMLKQMAEDRRRADEARIRYETERNEMNRQQFQMLRDELVAERARATIAITPKSSLDVMREEVEKRKLYKELMQEENGDKEEEKPTPKPGNGMIDKLIAAAPYLMPFAMKLLDVAPRMMGIAAAQGGGQGGQPQTPNGTPAAVAAPAHPQQIQEPRMPQTPEEQEAALLYSYLQMLDSAKYLLFGCLKRGESGADFADKIIEMHPDEHLAYEKIRDLGKERILAILRAHPQIAEKLPASIDVFVDEFLERDKIRADEAEADEK